MRVVIGGKPESTIADPIGLLCDCHRRIERFLSVLVQIASEADGGRLSKEQCDSRGTALRYFREAAPKHTATIYSTGRLTVLAVTPPIVSRRGWTPAGAFCGTVTFT